MPPSVTAAAFTGAGRDPAATTVASLACAALGLLLGLPALADVCAIVVAGSLSWTLGVRATVVATTILFLRPSFVGEQFVTIPFYASLVMLVAIASVPADGPHARRQLASGCAIVALAAGVIATGSPVSFVIPVYAPAAVGAWMLASRPELAHDVLLALLALVAIATASWFISNAAETSTNAHLLHLTTRTIFYSWPATLTSGGGELWWNSSPGRLVLLTGEPGLNIFYLAPAASVLLFAKRWRPVVVAVVVAGFSVAASQSLTELIVLAGGLVASGFQWTLSRRHYLLSAIVACAGGVAVVVLALSAVSGRQQVAASSLTDRGIGGSTTGGGTTINLLQTVHAAPLLAICIVAALGCLAWNARRSTAGIFVFAAFTLTALFSEPSQWQVGGWLLAAAAAGWASAPERA
jgi:hypothetical protein